MNVSRRSAVVAAAVFVLAAVLLLVFLMRPEPPAPSHAGDFTLSEGKAYFVENRHLGRLYVIEGAVTNNLASPKCRIAIKATLLDANDAMVAEKTIEAGLTAGVSELKFLGREEMAGRLEAPQADPCKATRVEPGGTASFMAVFQNPPDKAKSFTLVVTGSQ
ncbi:MAG: DUF3426 domain-containing protein [Thermodesulfobacteriota bacterium]